MVLFLVAMHDPETRLTSQGEHALIRPWLWTLASDVGILQLFYVILEIYIVTVQPNLPYIVHFEPYRPHDFIPDDMSQLLSLTL
jgi:hypothetical protein